MIEKACNLWIEPAEYRCVLCSGALTASGEAIMESALAREAATRFSGLATDLGRLVASRGNHVHLIRPGVVSFPIQQYQWSGPSLQIIQRSARQLATLVGQSKTLLPRPGCDAGGLEWEIVKNAISFLPDNVIVIQHV